MRPEGKTGNSNVAEINGNLSCHTSWARGINRCLRECVGASVTKESKREDFAIKVSVGKLSCEEKCFDYRRRYFPTILLKKIIQKILPF